MSSQFTPWTQKELKAEEILRLREKLSAAQIAHLEALDYTIERDEELLRELKALGRKWSDQDDDSI